LGHTHPLAIAGTPSPRLRTLKPPVSATDSHQKMINSPTAAVPDPRHLRLHLLDTKFFDFRIKYELLARDQRNLQEASVTLNSFPRNTLDQGMTFEQGGPDCVKIISLAYQLSTLPRQIAGSFLRHFRHPFDTKFKNRLPNLLLDPDQFRYRSLAVERGC
jgi:hypothetical protein